MPRTLNIGIVGCGSVTENCHLPALKKLKNVEVFALSDINKDRLNNLANRFKIKNRYDDPYQLISRPEIETVAVCAPPKFTFRWVCPY
jgi:predicted dehydrogenase